MRRRGWILALVSLSLAGCAVYRRQPDLDAQLTQRGIELAQRSRLTLEKPEDYRQKELLENSRLKLLFGDRGSGRIQIVEVAARYPHGGKGFQCFEPYLLVLSLGLIPIVCEQEYSMKIDYYPEDGQAPKHDTLTVKEELISGWISYFFAPFSSWTFKARNLLEDAIYGDEQMG